MCLDFITDAKLHYTAAIEPASLLFESHTILQYNYPFDWPTVVYVSQYLGRASWSNLRATSITQKMDNR